MTTVVDCRLNGEFDFLLESVPMTSSFASLTESDLTVLGINKETNDETEVEREENITAAAVTTTITAAATSSRKANFERRFTNRVVFFSYSGAERRNKRKYEQ